MPLTIYDERAAWWDWESLDESYAGPPIEFGGYNNMPVRLDSIICTSNDIIDTDIRFWLVHSSSVSNVLGTITVPALAGYDPTVPPVDAIPLLFPRMESFFLDQNLTIGFEPVVVPLTTRIIWLTGVGGYL
jgi:hypothetical protein